MSLEDLSLYAVLGAYASFALVEWWKPARPLEPTKHWRAKGVFFFILYLAVSTALPFLWDAALAEYRLFDLTHLSLGWATAIGVVALELGVYAWHRLMHNTPVLWRWFHQMHHSAERMDVWGAMYFHPLDMAGFSFVGSLALVWGFGVTPEAALIANTLVFFLAVFQHTNVRTPHWLGYFIVRPEMHGVHHGRGIHAYNYCDLPAIDWLLGTYRNPVAWDGPYGFYSGASSRIKDMLIGRDISSGKPATLGANSPDVAPAE